MTWWRRLVPDFLRKRGSIDLTQNELARVERELRIEEGAKKNAESIAEIVEFGVLPQPVASRVRRELNERATRVELLENERAVLTQRIDRLQRMG